MRSTTVVRGLRGLALLALPFGVLAAISSCSDPPVNSSEAVNQSNCPRSIPAKEAKAMQVLDIDVKILTQPVRLSGPCMIEVRVTNKSPTPVLLNKRLAVGYRGSLSRELFLEVFEKASKQIAGREALLYERSSSPPDDYHWVAPDESIGVSFNLFEWYKLGSPGDYELVVYYQADETTAQKPAELLPGVHPPKTDSPCRSALAARGESLASHRDGRGAPRARRDDREYREYLREEQRRPRGCIARRMQPDFHHGLLAATACPPSHPLQWGPFLLGRQILSAVTLAERPCTGARFLSQPWELSAQPTPSAEGAAARSVSSFASCSSIVSTIHASGASAATAALFSVAFAVSPAPSIASTSEAFTQNVCSLSTPLIVLDRIAQEVFAHGHHAAAHTLGNDDVGHRFAHGRDRRANVE